jgi:hypothetical protein
MTLKDRTAALFREPLVHFLIAGAVVYAFMAGQPADPGERRILVNEAIVTRLADRFVQAFRRQPTPQELDGMIADHVREQIYYREALQLGLDQNDEVVIKRMRNKMLALASADAEAREPSEAELEALLAKDPKRYAAETRIDFTQIYLGEDAPANRQSAATALAAAREGKPVTPWQRPLPIAGTWQQVTPSDVVSAFGGEFAAGLDTLPLRQWSGPVLSGYGLHLVRVEARQAGKAATVADVRQRLTNDWRAAALAAAEAESYRKLRDGYEVVIEKPGE